MPETLELVINYLVTLAIAVFGAGFGVYYGIKKSNRNIEEQDTKAAVAYLQSASEEATYQSKVLDEITGNLENVNYKSPSDLMRLEKVLYYFDFAGIVLPYPFFSEKAVGDHIVRSRLSPTGINSIYRVQEQLKNEKNYILGKETRQQEYMLAIDPFLLNLEKKQAALIADMSVRKEALSLYKKHLNVLSNLLKREIAYIQGDSTADEVRAIDRKEELEELTARKKKLKQ